jgi:hypothetical protein
MSGLQVRLYYTCLLILQDLISIILLTTGQFERQIACLEVTRAMYVNTEIMFPPGVIPALREVCGSEWRSLVDRVTRLDETDPESLAFSLMMIRLDGCLECETDSYRALRGCTACALQTVRRFRSNERELLRLYKTALKDVQAYLSH